MLEDSRLEILHFVRLRNLFVQRLRRNRLEFCNVSTVKARRRGVFFVHFRLVVERFFFRGSSLASDFNVMCGTFL